MNITIISWYLLNFTRNYLLFGINLIKEWITWSFEGS